MNGADPSFARPTSAQTSNSNFTDSAVDVDATTASPTRSIASENEATRSVQSLSPISQSLTDRLKRLAASTWALEQDDGMSDVKRWQIEDKLRSLEAIVEGDGLTDVKILQTSSGSSDQCQQQDKGHQNPAEWESQYSDEMSLLQIHDNLHEVVTAMRLRQQEQRHLHQLTVTKIESVAQRCIFQEQQMRNLVNEIESLRHENRTLGRENDKLRDTVTEMESEASKKEVAVTAMTSAVAGLEGWIDDADKTRVGRLATPPLGRESRQRRAVVRGKGRFRGRYYIDEEHAAYLVEQPDARELEDGVRAWIRGFRDVEDACSSPIPGHMSELFRNSIEADDDEWGPFQGSADIVL